MLWGATSGVLVTIALSGVPLFKMDVLNKTPLVRLENVLNTCFTSANKLDVPMLLCCSLLCFLSVCVMRTAPMPCHGFRHFLVTHLRYPLLFRRHDVLV